MTTQPTGTLDLSIERANKTITRLEQANARMREELTKARAERNTSIADKEPRYPSSATLDAMERVGGSFVRSLAECYYRADVGNKRRLAIAFDDRFEHYEHVAESMNTTEQS